jgi:hypothetical protein
MVAKRAAMPPDGFRPGVRKHGVGSLGAKPRPAFEVRTVNG